MVFLQKSVLKFLFFHSTVFFTITYTISLTIVLERKSPENVKVLSLIRSFSNPNNVDGTCYLR
jgi:hypothetical protein